MQWSIFDQNLFTNWATRTVSVANTKDSPPIQAHSPTWTKASLYIRSRALGAKCLFTDLPNNMWREVPIVRFSLLGA